MSQHSQAAEPVGVVVVDDDFMVAKVHGGYVDRTPGFAVVGVARTGRDALQAVREARPALVLLDMYLPDMHGLDVLRELRVDPVTAGTDVIVITAANDVETVRGAMRGGAVHYLTKPFSYTALAEQLRHFASLHQRLDRLEDAGVAQREIDQVFGARPGGSDVLPKGLSEQTAQVVEHALRAHPDGLSAGECADRTALARASTRRYLEYFVQTGRAEVRLRYGGSGRPEREYVWRLDG